MKERPILFSAPMVNAILGGRKTQTRRVIDWKRLNKQAGLPFPTKCRLAWFKILNGWGIDAGDDVMREVTCPYGQPGDQLWVRETWKYWDWTENGDPFIKYAADDSVRLIENWPFEEWAEKLNSVWASLSDQENYSIDGTARDRNWRPSIFMPRWASRIQLEIINIRVERLNDISTEDALNEGVTRDMGYNFGYACDESEEAFNFSLQPKIIFRKLWESINGKGSWDENPWVWVVEFRRINPVEDKDNE